jgi:anhydro-N-acetylmuramic acid kinase
VADLYIGLMSGTSLDGVDGVLVDFSDALPRVLCHVTQGFGAAFKAELLQLNTSGPDELHLAALASNALARVYASVVQQLLETSPTKPADVRAVGAHGQTVRHRPQMFDGTGYTLQLNQPALLAELCGIDVVADFRSRDVAAGGQGAPLVPPFHQALFGKLSGVTAVLNIGGISNITVLNATEPGNIIGFDCGPGNALLDAWCQTHTGQPYDAGGAWALTGTVHAGLLQSMLREPFFAFPVPKSTGRDLFNPTWLQAHLRAFADVPTQDVQATLTELTAQACADSLLSQSRACERLIVCGGGAFNDHLMNRLQALIADCKVSSSAHFGLPPLQVEAAAFAWLAHQCIERQTASVKSVTGAKGARILGAIYPA